MDNWPKHLYLHGSKFDFVKKSQDGLFADYYIFNGDWTFTAKRENEKYIIVAVNGYTKGRIAEMLIGKEVEK